MYKLDVLDNLVIDMDVLMENSKVIVQSHPLTIDDPLLYAEINLRRAWMATGTSQLFKLALPDGGVLKAARFSPESKPLLCGLQSSEEMASELSMPLVRT